MIFFQREEEEMAQESIPLEVLKLKELLDWNPLLQNASQYID